jgi:Yip1-like protein
MPMGTAPTAIVPDKPLLSQPQRILNTFFDPVKTFTDLRRGAAWWLAFIVISICSYVFVAAVAQKIGFDQVSENQMKQNTKQMEKIDQLPPADRARAMQMGATITKYISYCFPIVALLIFVITAAIFMAIFNFGFGADVRFGVALAIIVYASLTGTLKSILTAITLFAGANPENFTFENPLASNLGFFVDMNAHPALYRFASSMDIFMIWYLVLIGLGFACVSKVKRGTAIGVVVGIWLLWVLGATALKAVTS